MERQPFIQNDPSENSAPFESDAKKVVRKHLEDKDHVITEEEIRNVRIGVTPLEEEKASENNDEN